MMLRAIPSVTALLFASVALAAPRSIDDCESIKEPDAYNRCLAAFGPVRGGHGGRYYGPANEEKHGAWRHDRSYLSGAVMQRSRSGRVRMEFTPGQGR